MPAKPQWLLHIPAILAILKDAGLPVVDRAVVERLFGLKRRGAIDLLHRFGGFQAGRTFLIDRATLIEALEKLQAAPDFQLEAARKERLTEVLDHCRRGLAGAAVRIPVESAANVRALSHLSENIALERGRLEIRFEGVEDLLARLYELSLAASNDFESFRAAAQRA